MNPRVDALIDAAADLYTGVPRRFARKKLRFDPVFAALLERGVLPNQGRLLDLGCGQGLLLALIVVARERHARNEWPVDWPSPPARVALEGIELDARRVAAAQCALGDRARVTRSDIRDAIFPACSAVVLLDVLMYLEAREQEKVLEKAAAALDPGGVLFLREADAGAGFPFRVTRWGERLLEITRGHLRDRLHYRTAAEWTGLLETLGFSVTAESMSAGTPFANVLYVCKKRDE